jgi:hypothetical protein
MKYLGLLIPVILSTFATPILGVEADKNEWATSIGTSGLFIRKSITSSSAIFLGANYSRTKFDSGSGFIGSTNQDLGIVVGFRTYLESADLNMFIDSSFDYTYLKDDSPENGNVKGISFLYGIEKHISSNFSVEGSAGIRYQTFSRGSFGADNITLPITKFSINYYF